MLKSKIQENIITKSKSLTLYALGVITLLIFFLFEIGNYYRKEYRLINYRSDYQAVFLNNGQVYFGTITRESDDVIVLNDVYYLKAEQSLQDGQNEVKENSVSLVRLGKEVHGPLSTMYIVRNNVLFVEELKDDSQVVQAIKSYQK